MKTPKTPKTPKKSKSGLITSSALAFEALDEFKAGWKRYALILACVAVPSDIIGMTGSAGPFTTVGTFLLMASLVMNVAIAYAVVQRERTGSIPRPAQAYYDGSGAFVRFVLVMLALLVFALPVTLGVVFYAMAQSAFLATGASPGEEALITFVCALPALLSGWWGTRFGLALIAVVASDLRPIAALRYARTLTIGRFWATARRYIGLFILLVLVAIPISLVTALLGFLKLTSLALLVFQLSTTFVALPLTNIYLLKLYRALEPKPRDEPSQYDSPSEQAA
jgi:hypothetical protein